MRLILTCTTTPERLDVFYYGVQSLLSQSRSPDLLLVNLDRETFGDQGTVAVPDWLRREEITVNLVEDLGSFTKLLPALSVAGERDLIVTADDDVLYGRDWLERLVQAREEHDDSIICARARRMRRNFFGNWTNYSAWPLAQRPSKGLYILPLGVGGVLYTKQLLEMDFVTDRSFLAICPTTDDLWFRAASMLKGTPVYVDPKIDRENMEIVHRVTLASVNLDPISTKHNAFSALPRQFWRGANYLGINRTANDVAWDRILEYSKALSSGSAAGQRFRSALPGSGVGRQARPEASGDE